MTRLARVVVPNYFHHVTQRGVRSINTFSCDDDRIKYLNLLKKYGESIEINNLRKNVRSGRPSGDESFVKLIKKTTGRMLQPCKVGRHRKIV